MPNITILVSAAERHEEAHNLMVVELASPLAGLGVLSQQEMLALLEQLQPELERMRLVDYETLTLLFFLDGKPMVEQLWSRTPEGCPGAVPLAIGPGQKLWKLDTLEVSLKTISL